ncbi:MAG: transposase, partial [Sodaliphilus sp.]|nr:transposase [Sodaliphilus sp.]
MSDRHRFRAEWHNYQEGVFFVTICAHAKKCLFGHIQDGNIHFSKIGKIIYECISEIPNHHQDTKVWNYVIMPN